MTSERHILISLNPKAGRGSSARAAERVCDILASRGFTVELLTDLDEVQQKAGVLQEAGQLHALVGIGGDGTAAELTNRTPPGTPITLIPAGTANLIAKEFRLPRNPAKAARMIEAGKKITLDVGLADGRLFLVVLTAGIDADIVAQVHRKREEMFTHTIGKGGHIGYRSYLKPIFHSIRHYPYPPIRIETMQEETYRPHARAVRWAFLFNIPRYGFGAATTPGCNPQDGKLDFCGFLRRGFAASLLGVFLAFLGKIHRFFPGYAFDASTRFRLSPLAEGDRIPYQLDGDPAGNLPVEVRVVPARLTLLVGEKEARRFT
ncbi:MAG: diacylglycerol/lipid kinase family protein [Thermoguttaceae bacterium]|jgi:diacylglycerol kinase (ATP)